MADLEPWPTIRGPQACLHPVVDLGAEAVAPATLVFGIQHHVERVNLVDVLDAT